MRLRPYNKQKDFKYIKQWVSDARTHALWSAKLIPYPFTEEDFHNFLMEQETEWGALGYLFMEDDCTPIGFCIFNMNEDENFGFARFIVLDNTMRGRGYGTQMIQFLLKYAFEIAGVDEVRLNVFDCNIGAKKCYEKAGFQERAFTENALQFEEESWGRYQLAVSKF